MKVTKYLDSLKDSVDPSLPSTHATRYIDLDKILNDDALKTQKCDVFGEHLLYFFYGRPSYRVKKSDSHMQYYDAPVVFIVNTEKLQGLERIYPFDSGAFHWGLYKDLIPTDDLSEYQLPPNLEYIGKLVDLIYLCNENYMEGQCSNNVVDPHHFEAAGLMDLARNSSANATRDERATSIEIIVNSKQLFKNILECVVLPRSSLKRTEVQDALIRWGEPEVIPYRLMPHNTPEQTATRVYERVLQYYEDNKLI